MRILSETVVRIDISTCRSSLVDVVAVMLMSRHNLPRLSPYFAVNTGTRHGSQDALDYSLP